MDVWDIVILRLSLLPCLESAEGVDIIGLLEWTDAARPVLRLRAASSQLRVRTAPHVNLHDWGACFTTCCAEMHDIQAAHDEFLRDAGLCDSD